jgi:hypothetical protein
LLLLFFIVARHWLRFSAKPLIGSMVRRGLFVSAVAGSSLAWLTLLRALGGGGSATSATPLKRDAIEASRGVCVVASVDGGGGSVWADAFSCVLRPPLLAETMEISVRHCLPTPQ